jgi:ribosomal protein S18 acetylase RimI-like enzyme
MNIRPMIMRDKAAVRKILKNTPEFTPAEVTLAEEVIDDFLHDPENSGYYTLVADVDSAIGGFVSYGPTPITEGTWDIYWIAVDHEIQGRGIGWHLMSAAEEDIMRAGGRLVLVETSSKPGYEKTNLFYQKKGYKEVARIIDFYMVGDDQVIYEKRFKQSA